MNADERIDRLREELQITRHQLSLAQAEATHYRRLLLQQSLSPQPLEKKEIEQMMNVNTLQFSNYQLDSTLMNEKNDHNYNDDDIDSDNDENVDHVSSPVFRQSLIGPSRPCHSNYGNHERNVVYKFVPPLEFLPAVFVAEYRDVIEIIEKYAQLYHRFAGDNTLSVSQ
ncbi:uncharacterized protein TM35_000011970 [Trypanosoma theileri]|uniref:Uncharacterized protein n=1 Tax=Trypanosoma theileri TaxID=67003 RepID=A0A1X0PA39_9TRYP|nr:uncharacterized protein TM35_000011970 [Trypanosoma theileri]ORC93320.1 hypothetical protein TM35_000011970 [Trypanosoma theileri]